jgi:hypothetical protein
MTCLAGPLCAVLAILGATAAVSLADGPVFVDCITNPGPNGCANPGATCSDFGTASWCIATPTNLCTCKHRKKDQNGNPIDSISDDDDHIEP